MSHPEFIPAGPGIQAILHELYDRNSIEGDTYRDVLLSSPNAGITDVYDPDALIVPEYAVFDWPVRHGGPAAGRFVTYELGEVQEGLEPAAQISMARELLLDATVSRAAVERVPPTVRQYWEDYKLGLGDLQPIEAEAARCALVGSPLGVLVLAKVTESSRVQIGQRIMKFFHPGRMHPRPVLAHMKQIVRRTIEEETI